MQEEIRALLITLVLIVIALAGAFYLDKLSCDSRWSNSGFQSQYGILTGCVIKLQDGRWIPADNYREI